MHIKCERTCVVCKNKKNQKEMFRINKVNNKIFYSENKSLGRGAYICKNIDCILNLKKTKGLNKSFKCNISLNDYEKIQEQLIEQIKN